MLSFILACLMPCHWSLATHGKMLFIVYASLSHIFYSTYIYVFLHTMRVCVLASWVKASVSPSCNTVVCCFCLIWCNKMPQTIVSDMAIEKNWAPFWALGQHPGTLWGPFRKNVKMGPISGRIPSPFWDHFWHQNAPGSPQGVKKVSFFLACVTVTI